MFRRFCFCTGTIYIEKLHKYSPPNYRDFIDKLMDFRFPNPITIGMAFTVMYLDSLATRRHLITSTFASSTIESLSPNCGMYSVEEGDCGNSRIKSHLQH